MRRLALVLSLCSAALAACSARTPSDGAPAEVEQAVPSIAPASAAALPAAGPPPPAPVREGNVVARAAENDALFVADEDHAVVRLLALPLDVRKQREIALPGRPAQVLALAGKVLVTIRDPGLLLVLRRDGEAGLVEEARVALPADAWGMALAPDESRVLITSAWTHQVSAVDLASPKLAWSLDVRREPRGVVIANDGRTAYVSHLVGAALTRIEDVSSDAPAAREVVLPPSPLRAPPGVTLSASLGYALALSPDGSRLFAPRHALGAMGQRFWYGAPTVDVLLTQGDQPLLPKRHVGGFVARASEYQLGPVDESHGQIPFVDPARFAQPRAVAYRRGKQRLLVASEGDDTLVELDARDLDPGLAPLRQISLTQQKDGRMGIATFCAAPSGVALSPDEATAFVFCRGSYVLASVSLEGPSSVAGLTLAKDPVSEEASIGRRIFYNAWDDTTSGGLGCAGCHPEGRDDGHTWHEVESPVTQKPIFVASAHAVSGLSGAAAGIPRQTPMLAGRLSAAGPYGWKAQNPTLAARAMEGFSLHRWDGHSDEVENATTRMRSAPLAVFLREGLVPPPRDSAREATTEELRGRELFFSDSTQCASCHDAGRDYTDRVAHPLRPLPTRPGFVDEDDTAFKTPSLLFLSGSAPYMHDGSSPTLEALIENNQDRMGRTSHLSRQDRAALVAFLKTL